MAATDLIVSPSKMQERLQGAKDTLAQRVHEELWQVQVQQIRTQDWFNFASDGYLLTDERGIILDANHSAAALLDTRKGFLPGKPLGLFMHGENRRTFYQHLARLIEYGSTECWEAQLRRSEGEPRDVMLKVTVLPRDQDQAGKLRWMLQDVSQARQTERAWQDEKSLADCVLETADILIFLVDRYGTILRCNRYAVEMSGYDEGELQGKSWPHLLLPDSQREAGLQLLHEAQINGSSRSGILDLSARSGPCHHILWSARKLGRMFLLIGQDVTQLQEAQQQSEQTERLSALGRTIAGLGHEGRNALQRIQACLAILSIRLQGQSEELGLLARIQKAQDDLQHLFEDVRNYVIVPRLQRRWHDLRQIWREAWSDLASLPQWQSAQFHEDIAGSDPCCPADPFYLKQIFRNLLENALTCGANPAHIVIHCRPASLGQEEAICLRLRDNGPGIPAEIRSHLFEPFFTTKAGGTGLGLALCKRIVEAHDGRIDVNDQMASGTEIVITLPRRGA